MSLSDSDTPTILAAAGGLGFAPAFGGAGGFGLSVGVSAATNKVTDTALASINGSTVVVTNGGVSLSATDKANVSALTVSGAVTFGTGTGRVSTTPMRLFVKHDPEYDPGEYHGNEHGRRDGWPRERCGFR